jgi:hypothetical protein
VNGGRGGCYAVTGIGHVPIAGDSGDDTVGVNFADAVVVVVGDVQIARAIESDPSGEIKESVGGRSSIAEEPRRTTSPGDGTNDAGCANLPDHVVVAIIDVNISDGSTTNLGNEPLLANSSALLAGPPSPA